MPDKIILILYKEAFEKYKLNYTGIEIIIAKENIKHHKKYFYTMLRYSDYAIITIDDDIYYSPDTVESLFESYISHPNIISGRRSHLIKYKYNKDIDKYSKWEMEQIKFINPDFNIFLTTGAGTLYPPDILNIEKKHLNLNILTNASKI